MEVDPADEEDDDKGTEDDIPLEELQRREQERIDDEKTYTSRTKNAY